LQPYKNWFYESVYISKLKMYQISDKYHGNYMYLTNEFFKGALSLEIENFHISLYFIEDTNNLCNNALVEYIDN